MNCTLKEYTKFDADMNRTSEVIRVLYRNRQVVKAEGDFSGPDWLMTRERWGRGEKNIPGMERERREAINMAQYFGDMVPKNVKKVETMINEEGETVVKPVKRGRVAKYSEEHMRKLAEEIIKSGKTFGEFIKIAGLEEEKSALYARLKSLKIEVPQGKKGRQKAGAK